MSKFDCWQKSNHSDIFDSRLFYPTIGLKQVYQNFNEFHLMDKYLPKESSFSLLDIGCATGEISRYIRHTYPTIKYKGADISKVAIDRARAKYPTADYMVIDPELNEIKTLKTDYIFSRDVILHQEDPFTFLKKVCSIAQKGVFLRLRTRDQGKTVLDTDQSCQVNYGLWAPYIILNCDEIIAFLAELKLCTKIVIVKNYMILGGSHNRYLPKDCYLAQTGTAESAMYIEIGQSSQKPQIEVQERAEDIRIPLLWRLLKRSIEHTTGPLSSRVWW